MLAATDGLSDTQLTVLALLRTPRLLRLARLLRFFDRMRGANVGTQTGPPHRCRSALAACIGATDETVVAAPSAPFCCRPDPACWSNRNDTAALSLVLTDACLPTPFP